MLSVVQQLECMKEWLARMENAVGHARASEIMADSVFVTSAGTNDFVYGYGLFIEEYEQFILDQVRVFLKVRERRSVDLSVFNF